MKAVANSSFKTRELVNLTAGSLFSTDFNFVPADGGGALFRNRVNNILVRVLDTDGVAENTNTRPLSLFVLDACQYAKLPPEFGVDDVWEVAQVGYQLDIGYGSNGTDTYFSGSVSESNLVIDLSDIQQTLGGDTLKVLIYGGSVDTAIGYIILLDRVQITQDEYMKYFAITC